jgi:membrane protease YdiL (CAAX protease family)
LSIVSAFLWTFAATVTLVTGLAVTDTAQLAPVTRPIAMAVWEAFVYVAMAAGVLRVHARAESPSAAFGLRHVGVLLVLLACLMGAVVQLPVETLRRAAHALAPPPAELQVARATLLAYSSRADALVVLLSLVVVAPLAEELFFRGALYGQLRRVQGPVSCGSIVALCFVIGHPQTQSWLPLAVVASMLSYVRETTRSLWPGFALHATFNAVTIATAFMAMPSVQAGLSLPWPVLWAGWPLTAGLCYILYRAAKSVGVQPEQWSEDMR